MIQLLTFADCCMPFTKFTVTFNSFFLTKPHFTLDQVEKKGHKKPSDGKLLFGRSFFPTCISKNQRSWKRPRGAIWSNLSISLQIKPKSSKTEQGGSPKFTSSKKKGEFTSSLKNSVLALQPRNLLCETQFLFDFLSLTPLSVNMKCPL